MKDEEIQKVREQASRDFDKLNTSGTTVHAVAHSWDPNSDDNLDAEKVLARARSNAPVFRRSVNQAFGESKHPNWRKE